MFSRRQAALNAAKSAVGVDVPVVQARSLSPNVLADVAARYGVTIREGCRAVAVPRGAAGQVWRPNAQASLVLVRPSLVVDGVLADAGGAIGPEAYRAAVVASQRRRVQRGPDPETLLMHERLRGWHAQGLTDAEIGAQMGLNGAYVGQVRRALGLPVNDPRNLARVVADTAFMGRVRALVAAGGAVTQIAVALKMCPKRLRRLLAEAQIEVAPSVRVRAKRGRKGHDGLRLAPHRDAVLAMLQTGAARRDVAAHFKVSPNTLRAAVRAWGVDVPMVRGGGALIERSSAAKAARMVQLRALMNAGADEATIAAALELRDTYHLRKMIRSVDPDYPLPRVARVPNGRAERDVRVRALRAAGQAVVDIAAAVRLSKWTVQRILAAGVV